VARLLLYLCALALAAGESANPFDQAEVMLLVRDGRWVEREATRFAAGLGGDPAGVRYELARSLWRCRSFEGIDLGRPALLAWRTGKAPFLAAIPVSNRARFLDNFGEVEPGEPPLVRTGERDGSVIFTQNQPDGLWEYRVLVVDDTAYLARSLEECRRLAAQPPIAVDPGAAPLEMRLRGASVRRPRPPGWSLVAALPDLPIELGEILAVPGVGQQIGDDLAGQCSTLALAARSNAQGDLLLSLRAQARPDTPLAHWLAQQRPAAERLPGQLRQPTTAVLISGRSLFQGQLERWTLELADRLKAHAGARWSMTIDAAYRTACSLLERTGGWAIAIDRTEAGMVQTLAIEHPRAAELAQTLAETSACLRGTTITPVSVAGHAGGGSATANGRSMVLVAGDRHVVRLDARNDALMAHAEAAMQRLDQPGNLDAQPSLASAWLDLALAWNAPVPAEAERAEPVIVTAAIRPVGIGQVDLTMQLPLSRFAALLGQLQPKPASLPALRK
jgi:hypothetical protein